MPDTNLPMLEDAVRKLAPFLDEIVFVGGVTLGLLITDRAAAPIRGTTDVDVIAEIIKYADYMEFSERLRHAHFTEDAGEKPLICRWHHSGLTLDVLPLSKEVLGFTNRHRAVWADPEYKAGREAALGAPDHALVHGGENLARALRVVDQGAQCADQQGDGHGRGHAFAAHIADRSQHATARQ